VGCNSWTPLFAGARSDFAVGERELIDASECQSQFGEEQEMATSQPLFIRNVRGGAWHVLRWLKGHNRPILATEGNLLAIGTQLSGSQMHVTVLDLASRHLVAQFDAPDGYLSFASTRRLVLSMRMPLPTAPVPAFPSAAQNKTPSFRRRLPPVRNDLYSLQGHRLARLGITPEPPLVSHMHLLLREPVNGQTVLAVRRMLGKGSRPLIGFNEPARSLLALAFRWPFVAVVQSTSEAVPASEETCRTGAYRHPSPPSLTIFDVARNEPFLPPPPSAKPPPGVCPWVIRPATR
jgi:hypothetical protein